MRMMPRVHAAVRYVAATATCRLALAWDSSSTAWDGHTYFKSNMAIVDVTNEAIPFLIRAPQSSSPTSLPQNEFEGTVTLNKWNAGFGWFYYQQANANPCQTRFLGQTNANYGDGSLSSIGPFTPNFPTVNFANVHGLGDYVGIVRGGLAPAAGGYLFPSWAEPVVTSCITTNACPGPPIVYYSDRVMGAMVTP